MSKPKVTTKYLPVEKDRFDYGTTEFFIDGESIGHFDAWEEDASAGAVDAVLYELAERGIIEYNG